MSNRILTKEEQQEGRLALDLMTSFTCDAMLDVVLLSNDGGEIPASRFVLGARSPILQKMLFPQALPALSVLKLSYSSNVVNTLVNYCRTNMLGRIAWRSGDEASTRELVHLCHCAVSFQLKGLQDIVEKLLSSIIEASPHLICAIYEEAAICGKPVDSVMQSALNLIRHNPVGALLRKTEFGSSPSFGFVSSLRSETLEVLLSDSQMCTEEINLFRAVTQWADRCSVSEDAKHKNTDAWVTQLLLQRRRMAAKKIIENCIDLSKIAPSDLLGVVRESGLVGEVEVSNALIQLALRVEKEGVQVSKSRSVAEKGRPHPPPPPKIPWKPSQTPQGLYIEEDDSIMMDSYVETSETSNSHSYETVKQSNKRKPPEKQPKAVTPEKKKRAPEFVYQEEDYPTNSACCGELRGDSSATTSSISNLSLFLRDTVEAMCRHPSNDSIS